VRRLGHGGRGGRGYSTAAGMEARGRQAGGPRRGAASGRVVHAGGGQGVGVSVRLAGGGRTRQAAGGGADLSRVRLRVAGVRSVFLDKAITSVSHP
jgi:hypothetical protein